MQVGSVYSQPAPGPDPQLTAADSLLLHETVADFIKALEKKKEKKIVRMSLDSVVCLSCCKIDTIMIARTPEDYLVPVSTFIEQSMASFAESPVCKAYHDRGCNIRLFSYDMFEQTQKQEDILYEVWIPTFLPEEWAQGKDGLKHVLQFRKVGEEFRFYGFAAVW